MSGLSRQVPGRRLPGLVAPRRLSCLRLCDMVSDWPSAFRTASAPRLGLFRGSITRPIHSLSTLRTTANYSTATQDSLPTAGQAAGRDLNPLGPIRRFLLAVSSFSRPSWRKRNEPNRPPPRLRPVSERNE